MVGRGDARTPRRGADAPQKACADPPADAVGMHSPQRGVLAHGPAEKRHRRLRLPLTRHLRTSRPTWRGRTYEWAQIELGEARRTTEWIRTEARGAGGLSGRVPGLRIPLQVALPEYGERGSLVVRYRHDEAARVELELANPGLLPITVESVEPFLTTLGLLTFEAVTVDGQPLPVRLGPRESARVTIDATFGHCAYFTERAIDPSTHARVTWSVLGVERTALVAYPRALLVRSPTIVDCPGRVLDRSAMQRNRDATITGRG